jgi:hypothetical protein
LPTGTSTATAVPATPTTDLGPFAVNGLTAKVAPAPTREPRSRAATVALLAGAAVLILGVIGASAAYFLLRGAPEAVLNKVPSGADFVAVAHLDPAASQKMDLFRMTEKFPDLGSEEQRPRRSMDSSTTPSVDRG